MKTIEQIFGASKIVPGATLEDPVVALAVAEALLEANVTAISLRILSRNSLKSLELITKELPEMMVGAGGVMDAAGFLNASIAGAKFISSPGCTSELFTAARTRYNDAHFLPGVLTPTQVMEVMTRGINIMNIFPAEALNGYELAKTYEHAFPLAKFGMVGGITIDNMGKYLELPNVIAVSLSSITDASLVAKQDYLEIRRRSEEAISIAKSVLVKAHVQDTLRDII